MGENLELKRARQLKNATEKRRRVAKHKVSVGCIDCGYNANANALEFDHVDPDGKSRTVGGLMYHSWDKIKEEMAKCVVRCANCHAIIEAYRRESGETGRRAGFRIQCP